jgi:hypothetical protein
MPIIEMRVGDQTIRYDRDRTAAAYRTLEHGFAEKCGCLFCKNFAAQRNLVYLVSFRALLDQLGIDPNKEGEAFEYGPVEVTGVSGTAALLTLTISITGLPPLARMRPRFAMGRG